MGDIKKLRRKYQRPMHPWNATRIKLEKDIMNKYGVTNKKEIWKMESVLKSFKDKAKNLLTRTDDQANKERQQMQDRMIRLGLIKSDSGVDDILGLQLRDIMNRRLQTVVLRKRMARSVNHARQLITHEHILVGGKKVTSPSHLVLAEVEGTVSYAPGSPFAQSDHPEAFDEELAKKRAAATRAQDKKRGDETEEIIVFDEKSIDEDESKGDSEDASVADLKMEEEPSEESEEKPEDKEKPKPKKAPAKTEESK